MMFVINKIVGCVMSPLGIAIAAMLFAVVWTAWKKNSRVLIVVSLLSVSWLWVWSTGAFVRVVALPLERNSGCQSAEALPQSDVVILLGGGMSANPKVYAYADMHSAADRVWHAARIYKAGKAAVIIPSGFGDKESTVPLLRDFGVPESAIVGEYEARNTEENAKFVARILLEGRKVATSTNPPRALLVTSAWHMRRSLLMYKKYAKGIEIIPAPADFEFTVTCDCPLRINDFFPSAESLSYNSYAFKEIIGYWGYRLFR